MNVVSEWDTSVLYTAVPVTISAFVAYKILTAKWDGHWTGGRVIQSPWKAVVQPLSKSEQAQLPYPPNVMPGARDVDTPYGSIRVYEWGNGDGPKVLLIHGISTPCLSLSAIAERLVAQGKRVMLFDLFGRGYSDAPEPNSHPQNIQLFTTQIMLALSSSPLSWLGGSSSFRIVGYSLGGGIAATFTSYFPRLVDSLVLIAPAGIMRSERISFTSRLTYAGVLPVPLVHYLVRKRMSGGRLPVGKNAATKLKAADGSATSSTLAKATVAQVATSEVPGGGDGELTDETSHGDEGGNDSHSATHTHGEGSKVMIGDGAISIAKAVQWQLKHHQGFMPSFISSIQHAPISEQQPRWRMIGERLAKQRATGSSIPSSSSLSSSKVSKSQSQSFIEPLSGDGEGLRCGKVLMILGREDAVIIGEEVEADGRECLGADGLEVQYVDAGHDLPVAKADQVADIINNFWKDCS